MVFKMPEDGRTYLDEIRIANVLSVSVDVKDPVEPDGRIVTLRICVDRVEMEYGFTE